MNKRVLILSSSPRRSGNSDILCERFAKGATESGNDVQIIFLGNKKINYCLGCEKCLETHECVQSDDVKDILEKMVNADVLVFASPVYFYSMSAQLKTLIDRTIPRYEEMSCKDIYIILTAADEHEEMLYRAAESIRGFTEDCLDCCEEKGVIYGVGVWKKGDIENTDAYMDAYYMGKEV